MNRLLISGFALALALGGAATWMAIAEESAGAPFIKGGGPVTEEQIRQELLAEGYSNPQIVKQGRYFEAMGTKDGQTRKLIVDGWTGLLGGQDDEDED
jgi:hypothetical protein